MDETVLSKQQIAELGDQLVSRIAQLPSCIVAFSGGVDSAVVAKAAHLALGDKAVAITGVSASLASGELKEAQAIAQDIGIRHQTVTTEEINSEGYQQNGPAHRHYPERYQCGRPLRFPPRHAGRQRTPGPQPIDRMRAGQKRSPAPGPILETDYMGQAGNSMSLQSSSVWPGSHS